MVFIQRKAFFLYPIQVHFKVVIYTYIVFSIPVCNLHKQLKTHHYIIVSKYQALTWFDFTAAGSRSQTNASLNFHLGGHRPCALHVHREPGALQAVKHTLGGSENGELAGEQGYLYVRTQGGSSVLPAKSASWHLVRDT